MQTRPRAGKARNRKVYSERYVAHAHEIQFALAELAKLVAYLSQQLSARLHGRGGRLLHILFIAGLIAAVVFGPLVLLDLVMQAQIMELFLPATSEPWITPFGAINPVACGFAAVIVAVMSIGAIAAFEVRNTAAPAASPPVDAHSDGGATDGHEEAHFDTGLFVIRVIGAIVFVIGATYSAWGGWLRAQIDPDALLPVFANQTPVISALLQGMTAVTEMVASVLIFKGILEPRGLLAWNQAKLAALSWRYRNLRTLAVTHSAVAGGLNDAEALGSNAASIAEKAGSLTTLARKFLNSPQALAGITACIERLRQVCEKVTARWKALDTELARRCVDPADVGLRLKSVREFQSTTLPKEETTFRASLSECRKLAGGLATEGVLRLEMADDELTTLARQCDECAADRRRIYESCVEMLQSEVFCKQYTVQSQDVTLAAMADLVLLLDGTKQSNTAPGTGAPAPSQAQKIADALDRMCACSATPPPPESALGKAMAALILARNEVLAAQSAMGLRSTGEHDNAAVARGHLLDASLLHSDAGTIESDIELILDKFRLKVAESLLRLERERGGVRRPARSILAYLAGLLKRVVRPVSRRKPDEAKRPVVPH